MLEYKVGNLIEATESIIAHGCNAQGKMNSGVAKAIRKRWPGAFSKYETAYIRQGNELNLGQIVWYNEEETGKFIANCITQKNYGYDGKSYVDYGAIAKCMANLDFEARFSLIHRVAMPKIGAGLGGGDWKKISKIIEDTFTYATPVVYVLKEEEIDKNSIDS
jgi:O-acetyl-ADP-ribose deacetylase (regulator of RNase III)